MATHNLLRPLLLLVWTSAALLCGGSNANSIGTILSSASGKYLEVTYSSSMQPLVNVSVGGQWLNLVFDASSGNTIVFVSEFHACVPHDLEPCYSYKAAQARGGMHVCAENNNLHLNCETGQGSRYICAAPYLPGLLEAKDRLDQLIIDGLEYDQKGVEGKDAMQMMLNDAYGAQVLRWSNMPARFLVQEMSIHTQHEAMSLELFRGTNGILGASGPSLSCRNQSLWGTLLQEHHVSMFAFDLQSPPQATLFRSGAQSRIVLNQIDSLHQRGMIWSQPKQTGDVVNDGMHEFLLYHPKVCGVDLLYNASSNWLAVIDTSGPCLSFPPFIFDSLMSRIPASCPFALGSASKGRLCSPKRDSSLPGSFTLPALSFQLEDAQEPEPPMLHIPLERLVFKNASGHELLCVSRSDSDVMLNSADMMFSHIAVGSLALSALYTVVNLENHTIGFAPKGGGVAAESTDAFCVPNVTCVSAMQTYYPPLNVCEDPQCTDYMFMTLDEATRTCVWSAAVPTSFGLLLAALAALDLVSHRLYRQAIERASEFCQ